MLRNLSILLAAALVVALPFVFRREDAASDWRPGDPVLVIVTPHNEAIRHEFGLGFSKWHAAKFGRPVRVDWRVIGGTSEIARYLTSEYLAAARAWRLRQGQPWSPALGEAMTNRKLDTHAPPALTRQEGEADAAFAARAAAARALWEQQVALHQAFRATDDPAAFTTTLDLFFGGGEYDHARATGEGLTVPAWPDGKAPPGVYVTTDGRDLIPARLGGEPWRTPYYVAAACSTFGICYNVDRLADLGIREPPRTWDDLGGTNLFRQVGVADPTKSGSIAKAFELIVHQKIAQAVAAAGFSAADVARFEDAHRQAKAPAVPAGLPAAYGEAIEQGWRDGLALLRRIGANARYFTDSSSKVPVDVGMGVCAAGLAIDFYGRYQAEFARTPDGRECMGFRTPEGGSMASCDPVSLLRGAPHRELAVRFMAFVASEDGQRLWTYRAGAPGGPERFTLRRIPARRDFYPSPDADFQAAHARHAQHAADDLADPAINPYAIAERFPYQARWTGQHFNLLRDLVRAMCLDSGVELQAAWKAILDAGGPERCPEAMAAFEALPEVPAPLTWARAPETAKAASRLDYLREWTMFFRRQYAEARAKAGG